MNTNNTTTSQYFLENLVLPNNEDQLLDFINNQIGLYLTYCRFYGTDLGYQEFLKNQNIKDFSQHTSLFYPDAIEALARDFMIKENINLNTLTKNNISVENLLYEIYCEYHKRCFHGCAFIDDSILTQGLDASKKHPLNHEYLELSSKCKFADVATQTDYPRIYYSFNPQHSANFAYSSPSWIEFFISSNAYSLKNYDEALTKLQTLINSYDLSIEDKKTIIEFFNKAWNTYKDSQPVILEINNPTPTLSFDKFKSLYHDFCEQTHSIEQNIIKFFYSLYVTNLFDEENKNFTESKIPPSDIVKIHYLPHINLLKEKIKIYEQEKIK